MCFVQDLGTVFAACPALTSLRLACCTSLHPQSLAPLLSTPGGTTVMALPQLRTLDVSYCTLPLQAVLDLLGTCSRLEVSAPVSINEFHGNTVVQHRK